MRGPRGHGEIACEMVDIQVHLVLSLLALDRERPHAILARVGEHHRLDRIVEALGRVLGDDG